jgi:hypothetical protein
MMTAKQIIGYVCGGLMFAAGLTFYILGTALNKPEFLQPAYWLTVTGAGTLGLQISLPGTTPPAV